MAGIVGVLLAAGRGSRFDGRGLTLKLLSLSTRGPHAGQPLAVAAARSLRPAVDVLLAVVAPALSEPQQRLHCLLAAEGCTLIVNPRAHEGQATSLVAGVRASDAAEGWVIALADMPAIASRSACAVAQALRDGATAAAPVWQGRRGHPVGFARSLQSELLALSGDTGARTLLERHPPQLLEVEDAGVLYDVDTPGDLV
jgi:molybdenum cofactor cytidylyltransferase